MRFHVITLFPELIRSYFKEGVVGQALARRQLDLTFTNPRQFTTDVHHTVDDRPYGGGDGMVMMAEPLKESVSEVARKSSPGRRIYLSPQGKKLDHKKVLELAGEEALTLICGRYAGLDQRFINRYVDEEISIGDYVLSGGEAAAIVLIDAVARQLAGVLGHQDSAAEDSFAQDGLLEAPLYTRPQEFEGEGIPSVLLSGHHKKITSARKCLSLLVTEAKRPDLLSESHKVELIEARSWLEQLPPEERVWLGLALPAGSDDE